MPECRSCLLGSRKGELKAVKDILVHVSDMWSRRMEAMKRQKVRSFLNERKLWTGRNLKIPITKERKGSEQASKN